MLLTNGGEKVVVMVPCIHYPVRFQESQEKLKTLFKNGSKVNAISPAYVKKLGFKTRKTNVGAQKNDSFALKTFKIVIADFQVEDKGGRPRFFQEIFLMANIKFEVMLGMLFLKIRNANMSFDGRTFT